MLLTRKQFLDIAGPGALGAAAHSALGLPGRVEATETDDDDCDCPSQVNDEHSYQASAVAFGGQIELPYCDLLDAQAAAVLPPSGGRGSAHVENYRYGQVENEGYLHVASFASAHSEVFGRRRRKAKKDEPDTHETLATVTVTDLNIGDRVLADEVVARQISVRVKGDDKELGVSHKESKFKNLRIVDGTKSIPVELKLDQKLLQCQTFMSAVAHLQEANPRVLGRWQNRLRGLKPGEPLPDVMVRTTIFEEPAGLGPPYKTGPWTGRITVGNWTIDVGQLEITPHYRRLTLLRVRTRPNQLGGADMAAVQVDGRDP